MGLSYVSTTYKYGGVNYFILTGREIKGRVHNFLILICTASYQNLHTVDHNKCSSLLVMLALLPINFTEIRLQFVIFYLIVLRLNYFLLINHCVPFNSNLQPYPLFNFLNFVCWILYGFFFPTSDLLLLLSLVSSMGMHVRHCTPVCDLLSSFPCVIFLKLGGPLIFWERICTVTLWKYHHICLHNCCFSRQWHHQIFLLCRSVVYTYDHLL